MFGSERFAEAVVAVVGMARSAVLGKEGRAGVGLITQEGKGTGGWDALFAREFLDEVGVGGGLSHVFLVLLVVFILIDRHPSENARARKHGDQETNIETVTKFPLADYGHEYDQSHY